MKYMKLFENYSEIEDYIKDILIDWIDFDIQVIEQNNKVYVFIIHPDVLMSHVHYFILNDEKINDMDKLILHMEFYNHKLLNIQVMPSYYFNDDDKEELLFKINHSKLNNYYKPEYYLKLSKMEDLEYKNETLNFKDTSIPNVSKVAIGYMYLSFEK
jgi:hypothetical protein